MKIQDFQIFQKLFQIVSRRFLCTPPVSYDPEKMFSIGVSFHNAVPNLSNRRGISGKTWKFVEKITKICKIALLGASLKGFCPYGGISV